MRAIVQRVKSSKVEVDGKIVGEIGPGLNVLLGVEKGDTGRDLDWMLEKVLNLRVFADEEDRMNRSLLDVSGELLVVSQFTLLGDCRRGRRPSYIAAAGPEEANRLYGVFCAKARERGVTVAEGVFRAMMDVHILNDGPVTILLDSRKQF